MGNGYLDENLFEVGGVSKSRIRVREHSESNLSGFFGILILKIGLQIKESPLGIGGKERTDFVKLVRIIKDGGYKGYLPIETLMVRGVTYDAFAEVQRLLGELDLAIKEVYKK